MPPFDPQAPKAILPLHAYGYKGYFPVCPAGFQFVINARRRKDKQVDEYGNAYVRRIGPGSQPSEAIDVDAEDSATTRGAGRLYGAQLHLCELHALTMQSKAQTVHPRQLIEARLM